MNRVDNKRFLYTYLKLQYISINRIFRIATALFLNLLLNDITSLGVFFFFFYRRHR